MSGVCHHDPSSTWWCQWRPLPGWWCCWPVKCPCSVTRCRFPAQPAPFSHYRKSSWRHAARWWKAPRAGGLHKMRWQTISPPCSHSTTGPIEQMKTGTQTSIKLHIFNEEWGLVILFKWMQLITIKCCIINHQIWFLFLTSSLLSSPLYLPHFQVSILEPVGSAQV